jgi:hypothetical protein
MWFELFYKERVGSFSAPLFEGDIDARLRFSARGCAG